MSIDWNKVKSNAKAKDEAQYAAMVQDTETVKKTTTPSVTERVTSTVTGAAKGSAAGWVNAGGTLLDLMRSASMNASSANRKAVQEQKNADHYREMLARGTLDNGQIIDSNMQKWMQEQIQRSEARSKVHSQANEAIHAPNAELAQKARDTADNLAAESAQDIATAKKDLGNVGSFLVDTGVAGTQLVGDALTGGLIGTGIRTFGSGAQEARQSGATLGEQVGYGLGSAALGVLTEKIASVAGPFKKAFGSGVLDNALAKVAAKPMGKIAVSTLSEALEEGAESVAQPLLQKLTYNPEAAYDADWVADTLYSMAIGGVLGGAGGGVDVAMHRKAAQNPAGNGAGGQRQANEGKVTPAGNVSAQGVSGQNKTAPNMGAEQITTQENIARYRSDIDEVFSGKYPSGKVVQMGETPSILLNYGAQQHPLTITQNAAYKIAYPQGYMGGKHNLGMSALKQLPYQIADPVAILKSASQDKSLVIVTAWKDGDTDVIVPIHLDKSGALELENSVASAYGKGHIDSILGKNNENVLYTKNNEDIRQLLSEGVQFPQAMADDILAKNSLPQADGNVNVDPLLKLMMGGKRIDNSKASNEQFVALSERGDVGLDAAGRMFQINPEEHIDRRSVDTVGSRKLNAFQFDHPQLHTYFQQAANALIADADISLQFGVTRSYERGMQGNKVNQKVQTSEHLRRAMDETGLSRNEIIDAAKRIVNDKGQENVKAAKQVEIILDEMLTHGWQPMMGEAVGPNEAYIREKSEIAGSQPAEGGHGLDGIGAADAGSLNSAYDNLQAQSDTFHPEGAFAVRPVDVPTTNFEGRNIPKAASTIMGAQGIDEHDVRFLEQQIADGKLAFDTIRDTDAVARAQTVMREKGFDGALEQYRQAVAGNTATKDNTALGQQLLLQAMREGNTAYVAELLTLYTRNSTTAAQAMQAQSIFRKLSPEGQLVAVQKAVADLNAKYGTDVQLSEEEVADFLNAETPEARQEVTERIVARAAESVPGTFRAKYDTLRYLAMLGNPRTHIRNILGNTFFQVPVAVKNRVGAVAEGIAHIASGGKTERTKALFGVNPMGKLAAETRADWANAKDFLEQSSKYAEGQASLSAIERQADAFSNSNILGRGVNKAADLNSRALAAEDSAAKKWIYTQSLAGYLKANGCKSIADADLALLNRARNYAAQEALRGTFNDSNEISDAVSALGRASKSENKAVKAAGYVVEGVLPFKRTPANIAVRAVEYSPIGAVLGAVETMRGAKSGDMARVSVGLDRTAAGVSGTALLAAGFLAAGAGYVTGGENEDEKQQDFDDLTGHQNYALELKDGTSVTLDWLAPEAIPFFMGVELHNSMLDGGVSWDEAWETVKNAASPMLEMSMLQGLNDTFENAAYAKNRGDSVLGSLLTSALTNYATQIFPTLGGQIERSREDVRMTTYTEKDGNLPTDFQYTLGKVSQKIPGWDYQQIPYIDAWGRTEATGDALERSINNLFNPAYVSQVDVDELEAELQRLKDATGSASVFPERAERSITVDGEKKNLTAKEYQRYATAKGRNSYSMVRDAVNSAAYRTMGSEERAEFVAKMYGYADYKAKQAVFPSYHSDAYAKYEEAEKKGITPQEFYIYKESTSGLTADKDANGNSIDGSKKEKVLTAIDNMNLSDSEKDWLYYLNGYSEKTINEAPWR